MAVIKDKFLAVQVGSGAYTNYVLDSAAQKGGIAVRLTDGSIGYTVVRARLSSPPAKGAALGLVAYDGSAWLTYKTPADYPDTTETDKVTGGFTVSCTFGLFHGLYNGSYAQWISCELSRTGSFTAAVTVSVSGSMRFGSTTDSLSWSTTFASGQTSKKYIASTGSRYNAGSSFYGHVQGTFGVSASGSQSFTRLGQTKAISPSCAASASYSQIKNGVNLEACSCSGTASATASYSRTTSVGFGAQKDRKLSYFL